MSLTSEMAKQHLQELRASMEPWVRRNLYDFAPMLAPGEGLGAHIATRLTGVAPSEKTERRRTWTQYVSNFVPQSTWNLQMRLTRAGIKIETALPLDSSASRQQERSSLHEMFLHGVIRHQNAEHAAMYGQDVLAILAKHIATTAKVAGMPYVSEKNGAVVIRWDIYDPLTVLHDFGRRGVRRFAHETIEDFSEVDRLIQEKNLTYPARWGDHADKQKDKPTPVIVADLYCEYAPVDGTPPSVWNCIMVDGEPTETRLMEGWDRLPLFWRVANGGANSYQAAAGAGPTPQSRHVAAQPDFVRNHALPWFAHLEHTMKTYQDAKSLELDALWESVHPIKIKRVMDNGQYELEGGQWGPGATVTLPKDVAIEYLQKQPVSLDQFSVVRTHEEDMFRGYPRELHGMAAFAGQSGVHFHEQQDITELVVLPYANAMADFLKDMLQETTRQFRQLKGSIHLEGKHQTGERMGDEWERDFTAKDLPDSTVMRIKLSPQIPKDDARSADIFRNATESKMVDRVTGRAIAGLDDPLQLERNIRQQEINDRVEMQTLDMIANKRQKVKEAAEKVAAADGPVKKASARIDLAIAKRELATLEAQFAGKPQSGFTQDGKAGNMPPGTLPNQAAVQSPQRMLMANGQPTTGMGGRPGPRETGDGA